MLRKTFSFLGYADAYITHDQVAQLLELSKPALDRLIAAGHLTQYRCAAGPGNAGPRVLYARMQVERVKSQLKPKGRRPGRMRKV